MDLPTYLKLKRGAAAALAKTVPGLYQSNLSAIKAGRRLPPINLCVAIEKATNGIVSRKELRPDIFK